MDALVDLFSSVTDARYEEDFIDRVNYLFTTYVFIICSAIIGGKVGQVCLSWNPLWSSG